MTAAYIAHEQGESASPSTTITLTKPSATRENDLLIAIIQSNEGAVTDPGGWTLVEQELAAAFDLHVFRKVAGASEASTYAFTSTSTGYVWILAVYGAADLTTPIDVNTSAQGTAQNPESPSVTTTVDNVRVLRIGGIRQDMAPTPLTAIYPPGATGRAVESHSVTPTLCVCLADELQETAGATGPDIFTSTGSGTTERATIG